jgi:hypothetical protein
VIDWANLIITEVISGLICLSLKSNHYLGDIWANMFITRVIKANM